MKRCSDCKELEAENARLNAALREYGKTPTECTDDLECVSEAARQDLLREVERLRKALHAIIDHQKIVMGGFPEMFSIAACIAREALEKLK